MWSVGYNGHCSAFQEQQRLLFAMGTDNASSIECKAKGQLLTEVMAKGNCRSVVVEDVGDREALLAVGEALQRACAENPLLSRAHFMVVASTPTNCTMENVALRVEQALAILKLQQLDMLLLQAQSLPASSGIYARKRAVLDAWHHMTAVQREGLVQHIGARDLSIQDIEFVLTAYPHCPPKAWSIEVQFPGTTSARSELGIPLPQVVGFAHAHGIDVLARLPLDNLASFPQELREGWDFLVQNVAQRQRERPFKFLVTHENEGTTALFHMESHAPRETTALQTPLQIVVRYLLQKGLVIIPRCSHDPQRGGHDDKNQEVSFLEIFGPLAHSLATAHPSCSPHKMYSSLLTRDDLAAIDRALPFTSSFPA